MNDIYFFVGLAIGCLIGGCLYAALADKWHE